AHIRRYLRHQQQPGGAGNLAVYGSTDAQQLLEYGDQQYLHVQSEHGWYPGPRLQPVASHADQEFESGLRAGLPLQFDSADHLGFRNLWRQSIRYPDYF